MLRLVEIILIAATGLAAALLGIAWESRREWTRSHQVRVFEALALYRDWLSSAQEVMVGIAKPSSSYDLDIAKVMIESLGVRAEGRMLRSHLMSRGLEPAVHARHVETIKEIDTIIQALAVELRELVDEHPALNFSQAIRSEPRRIASGIVREAILDLPAATRVRPSASGRADLLVGENIVLEVEHQVDVHDVAAAIEVQLRMVAERLQAAWKTEPLGHAARRAFIELGQDVDRIDVWILEGLQRDTCAICMRRRFPLRAWFDRRSHGTR